MLRFHSHTEHLFVSALWTPDYHVTGVTVHLPSLPVGFLIKRELPELKMQTFQIMSAKLALGLKITIKPRPGFIIRNPPARTNHAIL